MNLEIVNDGNLVKLMYKMHPFIGAYPFIIFDRDEFKLSVINNNGEYEIVSHDIDNRYIDLRWDNRTESLELEILEPSWAYGVIKVKSCTFNMFLKDYLDGLYFIRKFVAIVMINRKNSPIQTCG